MRADSQPVETGVAMHEAFVSQGLIVATGDGLGLSVAGRSRFQAEGIDVNTLERSAKPMCRACLDWSERRHHLAGPLGAQLLQLVFQRGWAKRDDICCSPSIIGRDRHRGFVCS